MRGLSGSGRRHGCGSTSHRLHSSCHRLQSGCHRRHSSSSQNHPQSRTCSRSVDGLRSVRMITARCSQRRRPDRRPSFERSRMHMSHGTRPFCRTRWILLLPSIIHSNAGSRRAGRYQDRRPCSGSHSSAGSSRLWPSIRPSIAQRRQSSSPSHRQQCQHRTRRQPVRRPQQL